MYRKIFLIPQLAELLPKKLFLSVGLIFFCIFLLRLGNSTASCKNQLIVTKNIIEIEIF